MPSQQISTARKRSPPQSHLEMAKGNRPKNRHKQAMLEHRANPKVDNLAWQDWKSPIQKRFKQDQNNGRQPAWPREAPTHDQQGSGKQRHQGGRGQKGKSSTPPQLTRLGQTRSWWRTQFHHHTSKTEWGKMPHPAQTTNTPQGLGYPSQP